MKQIVFKRFYFALFYAVKTKLLLQNQHYLEEKVLPIKKIIIEKIQKKIVF